MNRQKVQCRLCQQFFADEDMSEEHYPAHSVGNDDIIALDFTKFMDKARKLLEYFKILIRCKWRRKCSYQTLL